MKNKKNVIILIVILLLLIMGGGVFGYIYFATDILKSDYELFQKFADKTLKDFNTVIDINDIEEFYKRKLENDYEHDGDIKISANVSGMEFADKILSLKGKQNIKEKAIEENIKLRYSDTENFEFKIIANNNILALGADEIVNAYIGVRNDNLKELAKKFGVKDVDQIPDTINEEEIKKLTKDLNDKELNKEDLVKLLKKYNAIIKKQLVKEDFSKNKINDGKDVEYILTISEERLNQILKALIEEFEKDETILNLLNDEQKEEFNELVGNIKKEENPFKNMELKYIVSKSGKITIRINQLELNEFMQFVIEKEDNNTLKIIFSGKMNNEEVEMTLNFKNLNEDGKRKFIINMNNKSANMEITLLFDGIESDNVVEKLLAEIEVTNAGKIKLEINDKINFKENVKVEKLSKSNTFIINDKTQEETISILSKIADRIVEVNKQKIEKAIEQASKGTNNPGIIATIMAYSSALNNSNINSKPNMDINTNKNENLTTDIIENIEKMESNTIF